MTRDQQLSRDAPLLDGAHSGRCGEAFGTRAARNARNLGRARGGGVAREERVVRGIDVGGPRSGAAPRGAQATWLT